MNEYSKRWWGWGLAGAVVVPVVLMALDGYLHGHFTSQQYPPAIASLWYSIAATAGMIGVSALPVRFGWRVLLFFLYVPLFIYVVQVLAPWAKLVW